MDPFASLADWPGRAAAAIVHADGRVDRHGDTAEPFALASVTKLLTAMAVLVAHEEGTLDLDDPFGPSGATTADLLAHAAGVAPDSPKQLTPPHTRRIYSTSAYDLIADEMTARSGIVFHAYLDEALAHPLDLRSTRLTGSAGAGAWGSVDDLVRVVDAWRRPVLVDESTLRRAVTPHLPELDGILPGFGVQRPNPWGIGPEIRGAKDPHWTAPNNSTRTYGHFGQSGTMLWIDPTVGVAAVALCTEAFGAWAISAWPQFSTDALAAATS
ncbi:MAG: serine hydrolase domain-containing protein [Actinomycetota bacterium]